MFTAVVDISPLLKLLNAVLKLVQSFSTVRLNGVKTGTSLIANNVDRTLISATTKLIITVIALLFTGLFHNLCGHRVTLLRRCNNRLRVLCRARCGHDVRLQTRRSIEPAGRVRIWIFLNLQSGLYNLAFPISNLESLRRLGFEVRSSVLITCPQYGY